ncbi:MAG: hypothetical protein R3F59_38825, partial [Myxococcota bacterium]
MLDLWLVLWGLGCEPGVGEVPTKPHETVLTSLDSPTSPTTPVDTTSPPTDTAATTTPTEPPPACEGKAGMPGSTAHTLDVGGVSRTFRLYVPDTV